MLEQAIQASPIPTFIINSDHKIILFIRALETLTGVSAEDALGTDNQWWAFYDKPRAVLADLNRAKDKTIKHLSHELRTPVAILSNSLGLIEDKLHVIGIDDLKNNYILEIKKQIDQLFSVKKEPSEPIIMADFVRERLSKINPFLMQRQLTLKSNFDNSVQIMIAKEDFTKIIDGILKISIENTPDHGAIEVSITKKNMVTVLSVNDFGIGITKHDQQHVFEGFFHTHESQHYSSKNPYEFGAGGRGADLLRTKIFSERYGFSIHLSSDQCHYIKENSYHCPGDIEKCQFCETVDTCFASGGTILSLFFLGNEHGK